MPHDSTELDYQEAARMISNWEDYETLIVSLYRLWNPVSYDLTPLYVLTLVLSASNPHP